MVKVRVPATSANMGAGFDTLGIALNLYNRIEAEEIPSGLDIRVLNSAERIPLDERNLIYRAMNIVFDEVRYKPTGLLITQNSDIPMTRGLGSSSACIIGGMLAANVISGRRLPYSRIAELAAKMEGHPDNVGPALYGGFCVSLMTKHRTIVHSTKIRPHIKFAVMIPDYYVATRKSREVLPKTVPFEDAVFNISHASILQAALISGDTSQLKIGVQDRLHQPYRRSCIDGFDEIFKKTYDAGSLGTYLSGSGPTVLSFLDGNYNKFKSEMESFFEANSHQWTCKILDIDNVGAVVSERCRRNS